MKKAVVLICLLFVLSACSVLSKKKSTPPSLGAYQKKVRLITKWTIKGRVSVLTKEDAWSGSLIWQQFDANDYDILFVAPITNSTLRLLGSKGNVILQASNSKKTLTADSPETLLKETMDWEMPVSGMRYWVLGLASPAPLRNVKKDEQGRVASFEQSGWRIRFTRYKTVEQYILPDKLVLQNDKFKIKVILKSWVLGN